GGIRRPHADVRDAPRSAPFPRPAPVRPAAVPAGGKCRPARLGLPALRGRDAQMHRRGVRHAGGEARARRPRQALQAAARPRSSRRPAGPRVASAAGRALDDPGAQVRMRPDPTPSGPGLHEALAAWAAIGVVAALVWITYARLPAIDFYNVTGTGFWAGASRVLVLLGWPMSIAAVALVAVAADRMLASSPPQ